MLAYVKQVYLIVNFHFSFPIMCKLKLNFNIVDALPVYVYMHCTYMHTYVHAYIFIYMHTNVFAYRCTWIQMYMNQTCIKHANNSDFNRTGLILTLLSQFPEFR